MKLTTYKEIRKLKGKYLIGLNDNEIYHVTSSTNKNVVLNNGITIKTNIFLESKQEFYSLLEIISINGVVYPVRDVVIKNKMTVNISCEALQKALNIPDEWNEVPTIEEQIDGMIYFYVPDDIILKPIKELTEYVNNNLN